MLGDLIYEAQGKLTGTRVLDAEDLKMESSFTAQGKIKGVEVTEMGTFWSAMRPGGVLYGEDQAILMTKDGDVAPAQPRGIGHYTGPGKVAFKGAAIYGTNCTGKLSFLNNFVMMFEADVDQINGTISIKGWEWK